MKREINNPEILEKINNLLKENPGEMTVGWTGGNDEGCFDLYINDEQIPSRYNPNNDVADILDFVADNMPYGSFAGDFDTSGTLYYDPSEMKFSGEDYYSERDCIDVDMTKYPVKIRIPKDLWFDTINIDVDAYESLGSTVRFFINNGPVVDEHVMIEESIREYLDEMIRKIVDNAEGDFESMMISRSISHSEFKLVGEFLEYDIIDLYYEVMNSEARDVCFYV